MNKLFRILFAASTAMIASCDTGQSTPDPTPIPSPVPTPTPTPTASPTPPTPAGLTITNEATSPLVGALQYTDVSGNGTARWATDLNGRFPPGGTPLAPGSVVSAGFNPDYSRAIYRLSATGIDRASTLLISATAPAGATIVSPLTSLIDTVGSQAAVRAALQLDSGPYAIPGTLDLTSTSGVTPPSGAIIAANFRAILLSQAVYVAGRGIGALDYTPFTLQNRETQISAFIQANPSARLLTQAGAERLLRTYGDRSIDDAVYAAMAHLVTIYADAALAIHTDPSQGTRYMLGLQSVFFFRMERLRIDPGSAATVSALTPEDVSSAVSAFADYPGFVQSGTLFAGPDFDFLAPGASGSRRRWDQSRDGSGQRRTTGYAENDFTFNTGSLVFESVYTRGGLVSVSVPVANAGQISAGMQGSTITYQALPGFTGTTYFNYVISDERGQQATARFYVIVR